MMKQMNMQQLTVKWCDESQGQNVADVIGAGLNVVMSALNVVPDKRLITGTAEAMRHMAEQLDKMTAVQKH
jgi:hypothetical protein